ncbi:MAG: hypothetical protein HC910_18565 [Spirulinaceae cyanobacterium SM2_1_0]|nr:hypothetical protein [Spirulinaceae cyanobacterium SM2_1_0]
MDSAEHWHKIGIGLTRRLSVVFVVLEAHPIVGQQGVESEGEATDGMIERRQGTASGAVHSVVRGDEEAGLQKGATDDQQR